MIELREAAAADHAKRMVAMRHWLKGKEFHVARQAFEYGARHHPGLRKCGVQPNFSHQVFIAQYVQTLLPGLVHREESLSAAFLHDTPEDRNFGHEEIEKLFGPVVGRAVRLLTKKHRGVSIPYESYFAAMAEDPIASIVKGADRLHNLSTMAAAGWSADKQEEYVDEVDRWFHPMLKRASGNFMRQEEAYHNVRTFLRVQCDHVRASIEHRRELEAFMAETQEPEEVSAPRLAM